MTNTPQKFQLTNVRAVFPKYFKGQEESFQGKGDPYFSGAFIIEPTDKQVELVKAMIREVAEKKFGAKADSMLKIFAAKDKLPLHDGDAKADKPYGAAYKGKLFVSGRNNATKNPPIPVFDNVIDPATGKARRIELASDPKAPYSGCYVNVYLNVFYYNQGGGEGIGASILGVQICADGERLSGGVPATADDYQAVPEKAQSDVAASGKGAASLF
jgi:hypothetical protein